MGLTKHQVEERFQSIADFAAIGDFIEMPVKTYSSGMYARLAFAVAAHVDADIMIVDEILSVGDIAFEQGIRLHELTMLRASLEEAYMEVTADAVEYHAVLTQKVADELTKMNRKLEKPARAA